jgi:hypothetical protein
MLPGDSRSRRGVVRRHAGRADDAASSPVASASGYPVDVTTPTLAFDRLAEQAVSARGGADLYRFGLSDRIPDSAFAANGDGSVTISGLDLLKAGTFNGLSLLNEDLDAMAQRFAQLADAGIFLPPFRLDHSWSILSVVGWFEGIETYTRVDTTDSMEKTFLRGDVRITGSVDYKPAQIVDAIKRGALTNRSSELGYYVTNSGLELPLVFYGCAFVDIPAVEGLAPVSLSRLRRSEPHSITNLSLPEGTARMDPAQLARLAALRGQATLTADESVELGELETLAQETGTEVPDPDNEGTVTAPSDAGDNAAADDETPNVREGEEVTPDSAGSTVENETGVENGTPGEGEEGGQSGGDTGTPAGTTAAAPPGAPADTVDELSRLRQENARLRQEATDRVVTELRSAGVIVQENETDAVALLSHDDEDVRRRAGALLRSIPARLELGRRRGQTALSSRTGNAGTEGQLIRIGMSKDEVGPLWADLSTEERAARQPEYAAWAQHRRENGITD